MLRQTSTILQSLGVVGPTLMVDEARARRNIRRMADKARRAGVALRPHFKTHQSAAVGRWFAAEGVDRITVSSVVMAERFAESGWRDITVAFLLNPLELPRLAGLARFLESRGGRLGVTVDSLGAAGALAAASACPAAVWLKVDTGYGRTGIPWDDTGALAAVAGRLPFAPVGLLAHAGHSYRAGGAKALQAVWDQTRERLQAARGSLGLQDLRISAGDTPTCSVVEDLAGVDEIRPGNFVFYDLMQLQIGSCSRTDLAAAACPVVGVYPGRRQVVIHGGAVHLSKESIRDDDGRRIWGRLGSLAPGGRGFGDVDPSSAVVSLSQEHGVVEFRPGDFDRAAGRLGPGDLVLVWPVHSCLTCDLLDRRLSLAGSPLD